MLNLIQDKISISSNETKFLCVIRCWGKISPSSNSAINFTKPVHELLDFLFQCDPFLVRVNKLNSTNISIFELQLLYVVFKGLAQNNSKVNEILEWWFSPSELPRGRLLLKTLINILNEENLEYVSSPWRTEYRILFCRVFSKTPKSSEFLGRDCGKDTSTLQFDAIH